jgi:hypothetical protein
MGAIKEDFGSGGGGLAVADRDGVSVASLFRDVADDLADLNGGAGLTDPDWLTGETVTTHVWTAAEKGFVAAVEGTTGSSVGVKTIQQSGSPAAGAVTLSFAAGVPTLTFNATDAITAASILFVPSAGVGTIRTTKV